jgi:hypothetical protein
MVIHQERASGTARPRQSFDAKPTPHPSYMRVLTILTIYYSLAIVLALILFVGTTWAGAFNSISILFYRGVINLAAIAPPLLFVLTMSLRLPWPSGILAGRDAVVATAFAIALNLTGFVLGPVTVDRSLSVFILSQLDAAKHPLTAPDLELAFAKKYLCEWGQIDRRIKEQITSGNLRKTPEGYRLTIQGQSFMDTARMISRVFGGDPRFVDIEQSVHVAATKAPDVLEQSRSAPEAPYTLCRP